MDWRLAGALGGICLVALVYWWLLPWARAERASRRTRSRPSVATVVTRHDWYVDEAGVPRLGRRPYTTPPARGREIHLPATFPDVLVAGEPVYATNPPVCQAKVRKVAPGPTETYFYYCSLPIGHDGPHRDDHGRETWF